MGPATERWISTFLQAQSAEQDAARNTQLAYGRDLIAFDAYLRAKGLDFATAAKLSGSRFVVLRLRPAERSKH